VFSTDVSSTFEFLSDENCKPEFLTTTFFVKSISKWFTWLMTSRYCGTALGLKNKEKYNVMSCGLHDSFLSKRSSHRHDS